MAFVPRSKAAKKGASKARLSDTPTLVAKSLASSSSSASESDSESGESSSPESSSSSSSTSPGSESDSDTDSEFGEVSQEYLNSLLERAKEDLRMKAKGKGKGRAFGEEDEIRLEDEQDDDSKELPQLEPGNLPLGYFDFKDGDAKKPPQLRNIDAERLASVASSSSAPATPPAPAISKDGRKLTKKEKKQQKKRTAGPQWFDLPAPDAADLPKLYREAEALRLRNALDPKRFYRREPGEGKGIKGLPEYFAIGTIVTTSTPFGTTSSDNLPRAERKRNLVDELVADSEAKRYAKRKFEDLQKVRGARGRGTYAKRFGSKKPKW